MFGLNKEQGEAVALLSIGTFLEYFDLMIYIHMAVLLNELFFPKTDMHTAALLSAFAFCSTYLLRPVGAIVFGYIGDHVGRKVTVVITTTMMSISTPKLVLQLLGWSPSAVLCRACLRWGKFQEHRFI